MLEPGPSWPHGAFASSGAAGRQSELKCTGTSLFVFALWCLPSPYIERSCCSPKTRDPSSDIFPSVVFFCPTSRLSCRCRAIHGCAQRAEKPRRKLTGRTLEILAFQQELSHRFQFNKKPLREEHHDFFPHSPPWTMSQTGAACSSTTIWERCSTLGLGISTRTPSRDHFNGSEVQRSRVLIVRTPPGDSPSPLKVSCGPSMVAAALIRPLIGGSFSAQGQSNVIPSTTNSQLTCKVDGRDGNTAIVTADNVNAWSFCNSGGLTESLHEVVVNITAGPGTVFCLDDIYSISSPNSILQNKYAMFVPNDGGYRYAGVSWSNPFDKDGLLGRETYATGAKVVIPFYGSCFPLSPDYNLWKYAQENRLSLTHI